MASESTKMRVGKQRRARESKPSVGLFGIANWVCTDCCVRGCCVLVHVHVCWPAFTVSACEYVRSDVSVSLGENVRAHTHTSGPHRHPRAGYSTPRPSAAPRRARAPRGFRHTSPICDLVTLSFVDLVVTSLLTLRLVELEESERHSRDTVRVRTERQYMVFSYYQQILIMPTILNKYVRSE